VGRAVDKAFIEWLTPIVQARGPFARVLELGSRNINGTIRDAFPATRTYIGLDMIAGPGVDVVATTHDLETVDGLGRFDAVVATSFFEHDRRFWVTLVGVRQALKPGGWFFVTVPDQVFPVHEYPGDYYRFTEQAIREVLFEGFEDVAIWNPVVALKPGQPACEVNQNIGAIGRLA